jgi:uncharacterized protein
MEHRAIVLSELDLPLGQHLLVHSCEDCACPVNVNGEGCITERVVASSGIIASTDHWLSGRDVVEIQIDPEHYVLFNPLGSGGVAVVNESAHRIFRCFKWPRRVRDVQEAWPEAGDELGAAIEHLAQVEMLHQSDRVPRPRFQDGTVLTVWLHVTNACNLRCPYCYVNKSPEGMDESVGIAAVEAVVRSAVEHGLPAIKLKYAGGEASLNHRLMLRLHAHARTLVARHGLDLHASMLTNGVALSPALIETLKSEGIRVMVSLDGVGAQHDAQRPFVNGRPSFPFVERTIARLIDAGHAPHISVTITNRNAKGVAEVVRFALDRNLTFSLNFFRDNDCSASFPDLRYEEQTMISSLLEAFGVVEEFLPPWSVLGTVLDRGQLLQPRERPCGVGQDYVVIDQRGHVAKCHMEIERTLGDVFADDPLRLVREDENTVQNLQVDEKEGCRDCTWRYWCSGGCAVATFRATGRYDIKSPNCNIYKAIYPAALRLEGLRLLKYAIPRRPDL